MSRILRFVSPSLSYRPLSSANPFVGQYRGCRLQEEFTPDTETYNGESYGTYRIVIENEVTMSEQYWDALTAAVHLIKDIELVWPYAGAIPLRGHAFGPSVEMIQPPRGWTWNGLEVHDGLCQDERRSYMANASITLQHYRSGATFFLEATLRALEEYDRSDSLTHTLVQLHYDGMMSSTEDGPHFLFAKALDIIRVILPGKTDDERQRNLPAQVQSGLVHSFHWFFDMANNRFNTRHAVRQGPQLHPRMTPQEEIAFLGEADLIIRGVVSQRLGIELVTVAA